MEKELGKEKGFTLIELLAVIVILGILVVLAIPAVTRYVNDSKKKTYIATVKSLVDTVRYGVTSGDSRYAVEENQSRAFKLNNITSEKGKATSPYGEFDDDYSFVYVKNNGGKYTYSVQTKVKNSNDYSIPLTNVDNLSETSSIKKESELPSPLAKANNDGTIVRAYSIGNRITYKGSNWIAINNSSASQDYVTLLKETALTNAQFGDYKYSSIFNTMEYYWSDDCHNANHGYSSSVDTGCHNHNDYDGSMVKEYLEGVYMDLLGSSNLKEVDGYKIRLIKAEELIQNLGWTSGKGTSATTAGNNVPTWVYKDFGELTGNIVSYWTMTPNSSDDKVCVVFWGGSGMCQYNMYFVLANGVGVRPVINLKKSAID